MPKFKITEGKYTTGKGKDRKVFGRGDHINLTMDQAKKYGLGSLELVEAKDEPKMTTNPGNGNKGGGQTAAQKKASQAAKDKAAKEKAAKEKAEKEAAEKEAAEKAQAEKDAANKGQ